jgi:hypothetical protein
MSTFVTPYSGSAELTASTGLTVVEPGLWTFSRQGYNDGATFGLSLGHPNPLSGGLLHLRAEDWSNAVIGNELTSYTDPDTSTTYGPELCRIVVTGAWQIIRQQNSNSYNSFNITYSATTVTDLGDRSMNPYLLSYVSTSATYVIQGSGVTGGAQDTFTNRVFEFRATETAASTNSNKEFQSNTVTRPVWAYTYSKSWQTAA